MELWTIHCFWLLKGVFRQRGIKVLIYLGIQTDIYLTKKINIKIERISQLLFKTCWIVKMSYITIKK